MKIFYSLEEIDFSKKFSVVTLGNFDGVHLGHQEIAKCVQEQSVLRNLFSIVIIIDPHPSVILGKSVPPLLTPPMERFEYFKTFQFSLGILLSFSKKLSQTSARDFLGFLQEKTNMKVLCIGKTTHVGKNREGTPSQIARIGNELGFEVHVSDPVLVGEKIVNSTRIRHCIQLGDVGQAKQCLGRFYQTLGKIVTGDGRGTGLGFPTANLDQVKTLLPKRGVYLTRTWVENVSYWSLTNIGVRPTIGDGLKEERVETHLFDFQGNVVGQDVRIEWIEYLREEKHFLSLEDLQRQIQEDQSRAKKIIIKFKG